jgi:hypothetical protein
MTGTSEQGNHKRRFQADLGNQGNQVDLGNQGNQVDRKGRPYYTRFFMIVKRRWKLLRPGGVMEAISCGRQQGPIKGGKDNALETL